jgi:hypothetical protein
VHGVGLGTARPESEVTEIVGLMSDFLGRPVAIGLRRWDDPRYASGS